MEIDDCCIRSGQFPDCSIVANRQDFRTIQRHRLCDGPGGFSVHTLPFTRIMLASFAEALQKRASVTSTRKMN